MKPRRQASLNTHYTNTHDRFFRACFDQKKYAKELLKFWLPQSVQIELDVEQLQKQESSLPTIGKETDLLFRGELKDKNTTPAYILLEHKCQRGPKNTYRQLADYGVAIRHNGLSQYPKERPVVLNCIFYHGKEPWHKGSKQGFNRVVYDVGAASMDPVSLSFHVLDLARVDLSALPKNMFYSMMHALREVPQLSDEVKKKGAEFFRKCLGHLDKKEADKLVPSVVQYVADVYNLTRKEVLGMAKSSGAKDLSFFESWEKHMGNPWKEEGRVEGLGAGLKKGLEKGRVEGLNTGLKKGRAEVAVNMLKKGLKLSVISEVTGLPQDEIQALKKG